MKPIHIPRALLNYAFPIERKEMAKFGPMFLSILLISFVYNLLRPVKMTLTVASSQASTEIIPFLKFWGVIPAAFVATSLYTSLARRFSRDQVINLIVMAFVGSFIIFILGFLFIGDALSLTSIGNLLRSTLPLGAKGFIAMIEHWHISLFYILIELWPALVLSVLFWGLANEVVDMEQASRFYFLFTIGGNLGSVFAGKIGASFSSMDLSGHLMWIPGSNWNKSIFILISIAIVCCFLITKLIQDLHNKVLCPNEPNSLTSVSDKKEPPKVKKEKSKITIIECFRQVSKSSYLLYLSVIVFGYNIAFNLTDVIWTDTVRIKFENDSQGFNIYMSQITTFKGYISLFIAFIAPLFIRKFGWKNAAILTPVILLVTSLGFYPLIMQQGGSSQIWIESFAMSISEVIVLVGALQNSLARACKYTIYDATKEMAFIPLDQETKRKGKAVIDGIGSRIGKSLGSVIFQILLLIYLNLQDTVPIIAAINFIVVAAWIYSVIALNKEMKKMVFNKKKITSQEKQTKFVDEMSDLKTVEAAN